MSIKLELTSFKKDNLKEVTEEIDNPTLDILKEKINSVDWNKFAVISLTENRNNSITCSGSMKDGLVFSSSYQGSEFIMDEDVKSIDLIIDVFVKFLNSDPDWIKGHSWSNAEESNDNADYEDKLVTKNPIVLILAFFKVIYKYSKIAFYLLVGTILFFIIRYLVA